MLNNLNENNAKGVYDKTVDLDSSPTGSKSIYDNYYNRCPNGDNNNLLTDDVVLDVWDVNSKVGKPAAGVLTQPVMDINPVSGMVGFAFKERFQSPTLATTVDGTAVCAGQYVSIAALKGKGDDGDDAVVAVWYDATNNQMLYSYNKKPKSIAAGKFLQADTGWSKPVPIFGEDNGIGEYCKVALDKKGGAHVVAYDSLNADVVYAYLSNFDDPDNAKTCIVDSYGLIGTELDIAVALDDDENPLPFHFAVISAASSATS